MSKRLDFGCVWINTHIPLVAEMPHGGFKHSGYGKDLSMYGFEDYTRIKHVMANIESDTDTDATGSVGGARAHGHVRGSAMPRYGAQYGPRHHLPRRRPAATSDDPASFAGRRRRRPRARRSTAARRTVPAPGSARRRSG